MSNETWKFAGARVWHDGTKKHAWVDADGVERHFTARGTYSIGGTYTVDVDRTPGADEGAPDRCAMGSPVFTHKRDPQDPQVLAWEAAHYAAETRLAAATRERQAIKETALQDALRPLREAAKSLRTQADRTAFAARIIREIEGAWH